MKYIEVYAHRGARSFSPENTLPAYKTALAIGIDWIDIDIGISKDGIIVVSHDIWLNPNILCKNGKFWAEDKQEFYHSILNAPGGINRNIQPYLIKNLTLEEIKQYDAGRLNPTSRYAKYFPDQYPLDGIKMPTLHEVTDYVDELTNRQVGFQIEIKYDPAHPDWTVSPQDYAAQLYEFLCKNNLIDRVEIQSFAWQCLFELQKIDKNIKTAYLVTDDDIKRMHDPDPAAAGQWSGGRLLKDYNNSLPEMIKALGGSCYEPEDMALTKPDLDKAHSLGLKVVVWTWPENSGQTFNSVLIDKLISWGVDGIITDDPARLTAMLAARGLPTPKNYSPYS